MQCGFSLTKFDLYSPQTIPNPKHHLFHGLLCQLMKHSKHQLQHFRCGYYPLCDDVHILRLLSQFISHQHCIETLNASNIWFGDKTMTPMLCQLLAMLLAKMMKNTPELKQLDLPTCGLHFLSRYLDICYHSLIESYHIWHHEDCRLIIPITVQQEWIYNICDGFSESQTATYFECIHQFITKLCIIYPQRQEELQGFCHTFLCKEFGLHKDVIDIITDYGCKQSKLSLQFTINIPLLGTNYIIVERHAKTRNVIGLLRL
eukprot:1003626_1